jgi:hypothetical protein
MLDATPSFIFGEAFLAEARRRRVGRGSEHPVKSTILAASLRGASVVGSSPGKWCMTTTNFNLFPIL